MKSLIRPALSLLAFWTVVTGLCYPALVTGIAQSTMPRQASGSLFGETDAPLGSALIGQPFSAAGYFWSRPSVTGPHPYNGAASTGSNLGPSNPALATAVDGRVAALRAADPGNVAPVPIDLVTSSASGLDPHLSPEAALFQVSRVAQARGLDETRLRSLVETHTEGRTLGLLGEPRVNALLLNRALDALVATPGREE